MAAATQNPRLRFGLWVDFRNPPQWHRPYKDLYAETLELITWGESIGYDDLWLSEHHFVDDGYSPSLMPIAAAIAVKTKKIRIGTSVVLLPMYDPVRLAEDGATVDILSDGRFELGAGLGYRAGEFEGLGLKYKERAGRMNEALEIIRRLWEGETLTFHGKHFHIEGARVSPEPVQKPRPPIWVGGFAAAATKRAARYGDGFIAINEVQSACDNYVAELRALGKDRSSAHVIAGHVWLVVANDPDKTWRELAPHVLYQINLYAKWMGDSGQDFFPRMNSTEELRASGLLNVATPEQAVELIRGYASRVPIERYYTWTIPPGYPPKKMYEHLELFATKVMPHFRGR